MKLYATVRSERAVKGQGGNKKLEITILLGDKTNPIRLGYIDVFYHKKYKIFSVYRTWLEDGMRVQHIDEKSGMITNQEKGEQQKGECQHSYCDDDAVCINCGQQQ